MHGSTPCGTLRPRRRRLLGAALALGAAALAGCAPSRPAVVPLARIDDAGPPSAGPRVLIVLLGGVQEVPRDLVERGFVRAVRERNIAADVVLPDLHLGYFRRFGVETRLEADIIGPARARGYAGVWLAGISLGGFGSIIYAATRPADVAGVMLIAPFIASEPTVQQVIERGGLALWRESLGDPIQEFERLTLGWLAGYSGGNAGAPRAPRPPLYLGYGLNDRLAKSSLLLADVLPRERVFSVPGGHDWDAWVPIWRAMLDAAPLPRASRAASAARPLIIGPRA